MFFRQHDKLINLDAVVRGERVAGRNGAVAFRLYDQHNSEIVTLPESAFDALDTETIVGGPIPAVFIDDHGTTVWRPIVGWRVGRSGAEPVFHGTTPAGQMFMQFADGSLLGLGQRFPNLAAAIDVVRDAAQPVAA